MLALLVLIYIAVVSVVGAVEYWIWLRQRLAAEKENQTVSQGEACPS